MVTKAEILMEDVEVRRFFPENLADIVGYPQKEIKYIGIHTKKDRRIWRSKSFFRITLFSACGE
ncbi:TPA: hypothetical protein HA241_05370 [Candidatus Woesearchaeota archaeon]|nr:hypothetical protein [Candidatus Woesearchaeota archaeon]